MSSSTKAGVVVLAAGSGTARLARRVGAEIPQQLVSQTVILTDPVRAVTRASWPACRLDEDPVTKKGAKHAEPDNLGAAIAREDKDASPRVFGS